ncbi:unnamed protein product, partial [Rotaria sp. Silwood2]
LSRPNTCNNCYIGFANFNFATYTPTTSTLAPTSIFKTITPVTRPCFRKFLDLLVLLYVQYFQVKKKSINDEIVLVTDSGDVLDRTLAIKFSKYGAFLCL